MKHILLAGAACLAAPLSAQPMDHGMHDMPGLSPAADPHAAHRAGRDTGGAAEVPPPAPPATAESWAADRLFPPGEMAAARTAMLAEHGGAAFSQIMVNIAETGAGKGPGNYHWEGEGWFGGDIDRLVVRSEGEGAFGEQLEQAEVQLLWSHAVDAYWNVQLGVRQDFGRGPSRSHATVGVEGLAPYWFEVEGALFLSDKGDLSGRIELYYDQRLTQRLILQPRAEFNFAAQDVPQHAMGSGLSDAALGLRLRYEIAREFAPYVGVVHDRRFGDSARFARAAGESGHDTRLVAGIRFWF